MKIPKIAIVSFPGNNCEVESIRAIAANGMEPLFFRWNADISKLSDVDGYFIPGGFSYEDRGRAGMIAANDPLLQHIKEEAAKGKVVIGNCNGAQILIESGLIPHADKLEMSLARNVVEDESVGFLNEWVWIKPMCPKDRCATSDWTGVMHVPIAHGEGRFTTKDKDLLETLQKNNQIAFSYCNEQGDVSDKDPITPNGSLFAMAGVCNPEGNVVALMPHPERTPLGHAYFASIKKWIESHPVHDSVDTPKNNDVSQELPKRSPQNTELFIASIIVNNEERSVEKVAKSIMPKLSLTQLRYMQIGQNNPKDILTTISYFNPHKEIAYIRKGDSFTKWNPDTKQEEACDALLNNTTVLRKDEPDTGAESLGKGSETGMCYVCNNVNVLDLENTKLQSIFGNPHASTLELLSVNE